RAGRARARAPARNLTELALARSVNDAAFREVIGRQLDGDGIALQDADVVFSHLARDVRRHDVAVFELHTEGRVRQRLHHRAFHLDRVFFGHRLTVSARSGPRIVA